MNSKGRRYTPIPGLKLRSAPAPQLNGKPDLSGLWRTTPSTLGALRSNTGGSEPDALGVQSDSSDIGDIHRNVFSEIKREEEPLKPEANPRWRPDCLNVKSEEERVGV
jgi:hypothetical protein